MKLCYRCLQQKPEDEFPIRSRRNGIKAPSSWCRGCTREHNNAWYQANLEREQERSRLRYKKTAHKTKAHRRKHLLWSRYRLTQEQFDEKLTSQSGVCLGCGAERSSSRHEHLSVDHDHACCPGVTSCGKCVRGLLCLQCNVLVALIEANPDRVQVLLDYLDSYTIKEEQSPLCMFCLRRDCVCTDDAYDAWKDGGS